MAIKQINYFFTVFLLLISCTSNQYKSSKQVEGKWRGLTDWANLEIEFTQDKFKYNEKISDIKFECAYKVVKDTLFLFKSDHIEKHIISKADKAEMKLETTSVNEKEVPYIDGLVFKKVHNSN